MIYLTSPYTHADPQVMEQRYLAVLRETARLLNEGFIIYSPIVHCHEMAKRHDLPRGFNFWRSYNLSMISAARELWVYPLFGWQGSKGVTNEIAFAKGTGKIVKIGDRVDEDIQYV